MECAANEDCWSMPSAGIVDHLVGVMKRTKRWSRDGPSLRSLNKHWWLQLNQHVVSVRPHKSRVIVKEDAQSLTQFPHLTSLDPSGFTREAEMGWNREVLRRVAALPKVSRLEVCTPAFKGMSSADMGFLGGITSLRYFLADSLKLVDVMLLAHLPLQELSIHCSLVYLEHLVPQLPFLRVLEVETESYEVDASCIAALQSLDELKLSFNRGLSSMASMAELESLVSLEIFRNHPQNVDPLLQLPNLRKLGCLVTSLAIPMSPSFTKLLTRLTDLKVTPMGMHTFLCESVTEPITLRSLTLAKCNIYNEKALEWLTSLTHLTLSESTMMNGIPCLTSLRRLKTLCLIEVSSTTSLAISQTLTHSDFPCLTILAMDLASSGFFPVECLTTLSKLEILGLDCPHPLPLHKLALLTRLPHLRELGVFCPQKALGRDHIFYDSEFLARLEALWVTNFDEIRDYRRGGKHIMSAISRLLQKAPHLKITNGISSIRSREFLDHICHQT